MARRSYACAARSCACAPFSCPACSGSFPRTGLAIPFFERLGRDLPFDQQLRELPPLRLALERHGALLPRRTEPLDHLAVGIEEFDARVTVGRDAQRQPVVALRVREDDARDTIRVLPTKTRCAAFGAAARARVTAAARSAGSTIAFAALS